jgi:hypothetical protein
VGMRAAFTQQADSITKSCLQGGTSFVCDYGLWHAAIDSECNGQCGGSIIPDIPPMQH